MRKVLLLTVAALLVAAPAIASTGAFTVSVSDNWVIYQVKSASTVAAAGIDTTVVKFTKGNLVEVDDDATTANLDMFAVLQNVTASGGGADSVGIGIDTSTDGSTWEQQYAITNDNTALNWGEIKTLSITEPAPFYRFRVTNKHASTARTLAVRIAVPLKIGQ